MRGAGEGLCPLRPEKPCSSQEVSFQGLMSHDRQRTEGQMDGGEVGGVGAALGKSGLLRKTFFKAPEVPSSPPPTPVKHFRLPALRPSHRCLPVTSSSSSRHLEIFAYAVPTTTWNGFLILPDSV